MFRKNADDTSSGMAEKPRPGASQRGYGARWRKLREWQLSREPLCRRCLEVGQTRAANTVHHRKAHKGDPALLYDPENLESLCKPCHDSSGHRDDHGRPAVGLDGYPVDPDAWE
jgi:5-methylcytosine-specific restriction protein A